jgi:hypothetical protein
MSYGGEIKVKIVALRTKYIVCERYINATGCLNIISNTLKCEILGIHGGELEKNYFRGRGVGR